MNIGIIGLGTIASAVVESLVQDDHSIWVSPRNAAQAARLSQAYANVTVAQNQEVLDASDVVFLGLLPEVAAEVLTPLRFRDGQIVVSLMADVCCDDLACHLRPARLAARMIPFPAIAEGNSPILCFGDAAMVETLFGARNRVFHLSSEADLDAYLCAQAVLSPALLLIKEAADWLAPRVSDPDTGAQFLQSLVGSSLLSGPCETQLAALSTPGGYNQRLKDHMIAHDMGHNLTVGLDALAKAPTTDG